MRIRVLLFASLAERAGVREAPLEVSDNATVGDAVDAIVRRWPTIAPMRERIATAVNLAYVGPGHRLAEGDELALIPPVSGG